MTTLVKTHNGSFPVLFNAFRNHDANEYLATGSASHSLPAANVFENEDGFGLEIAAPGLTKSDFVLNLNQNVLTVSAQKEHNEAENTSKFTRREFTYGSFKRSFTLPASVNTDAIEATYTDGILKVALPKREEAKPKPVREISVL